MGIPNRRCFPLSGHLLRPDEQSIDGNPAIHATIDYLLVLKRSAKRDVQCPACVGGVIGVFGGLAGVADGVSDIFFFQGLK
jgi:hypothetical protein